MHRKDSKAKALPYVVFLPSPQGERGLRVRDLLREGKAGECDIVEEDTCNDTYYAFEDVIVNGEGL